MIVISGSEASLYSASRRISCVASDAFDRSLYRLVLGRVSLFAFFAICEQITYNYNTSIESKAYTKAMYIHDP